MMTYIGRKYKLPDVFYLDMWPVSYPLMIIQDPGVAAQVTQIKSLPKHEVNHKFLSALVGHTSVVMAEGSEWKKIRSIINPGFSPTYLATLTPILMKHVARLTDKLCQVADTSEIIRLQDYFLSLSFDVICEVVLGVDTDSQRQYNALAYHYGRAAKYTTISSGSMSLPRKYYLQLLQWHHARQQSRIITDIVKSRWSSQSRIDKKTPQAAIDLFLEAYRASLSKSDKFMTDNAPWTDEYFMRILIDNTQTLLLGGHDTTSSSLSWTIALLSLNASALSTLRAEHSALFPDPSNVSSELISQPSLLNKLPYTTACFKEATRIFTPASTSRYSNHNDPSHPTHVTYNKQSLPVSGQQAWVLHFGIGRNPNFWPSPATFIPERHLPNPPADYVPPTGYNRDAWRIFEKGPRACLGMELAMNEIRLVLLQTMRRFDFEIAYAEDAPTAPPGEGDGEELLWGGKMYQVLEFAAKPAGHMPVRVRRREKE